MNCEEEEEGKGQSWARVLFSFGRKVVFFLCCELYFFIPLAAHLTSPCSKLFFFDAALMTLHGVDKGTVSESRLL